MEAEVLTPFSKQPASCSQSEPYELIPHLSITYLQD